MPHCHLNIASVHPTDAQEAVLCSHCGSVHRWDYHHGKDLYVSLCGHHIKGDTYVFQHEGTVDCWRCILAWDEMFPEGAKKVVVIDRFLRSTGIAFDARQAWWEDDKHFPPFSFNIKSWLATGVG